MSQSLPLSNYVNVDIVLTAAGAEAQNLNTLLILDDTSVVDTTERLRLYSDLQSVADDFGASGNIYQSAQRYFSQSPKPSAVYVGRWAKTASAGGLRCATIIPTATTWTSITNGSFSVQKNGAAAVNVTGLNFSATSNMSAVAAVIAAGCTSAGVALNVTWNAVYSRFEFESPTTGATSAVSFLGSAGTGTAIQGALGGTSGAGGYLYSGQAPESAVDAVTVFDHSYGQKWYALTTPSANLQEYLDVSAFIEASSNRHVFGVNTSDPSCLVASNTTNIGYQLKQLARNKTMVQYSATDAYAVASLLGRSITTDFEANNTVIDLMYKSEPGVVAEQINTQQAAALKSFNINAFVTVSNGVTIIQWGDMSSGVPIAAVTGTDWLAITLQNELFNLMYTSPTRIPQTEQGSNLLVSTCEAVCAKGVNNGLGGPGVWTSQGFGLLKQNDFLPKGFYVYAQPLSAQSSADRAAGKAPAIQIAFKLQGAFRTIDVGVTVNR